MTLSVSSLGKKTQTQRRSCMVLLLWKFSLFIFVWLEQDRRLRLQPGLWAHWRPASTTAGADTTTGPCSAADHYKHTSSCGLSNQSGAHKADHGDLSCSQPLWRNIIIGILFGMCYAGQEIIQNLNFNIANLCIDMLIIWWCNHRKVKQKYFCVEYFLQTL